MIRYYFMLLLALVLPLATTSAVENIDQFNNLIGVTYNEYNYLVADRTNSYDLLVIAGKSGDAIYYGIYIENKTNHPMEAVMTKNNWEYHLLFNDHIASYPKVNLDHGETYDLVVTDLVTEHDLISQSFATNPDGKKLNTDYDIFTGQGLDNLGAATKLPTSIDAQFLIRLISIVGIIIFLAILGVVLYFKKGRMPRYHEYRMQGMNPEQNPPENAPDNIIDARYEQVQEAPQGEAKILDKQAYMNHLFRMYENKEITEDELNEELKKLWWKNDTTDRQ